MATTVPITLVPKNECAPEWSRYKIFVEALSLDSCLSKFVRHPEHTVVLLLVGIVGIRCIYCFHASVTVDSDLIIKMYYQIDRGLL